MTEANHLKKFADSTLSLEKYVAEIKKFNEAIEPTIKTLQAHDLGISRWAAAVHRTMTPLEGMMKASQLANETLARHSAAAEKLTRGIDAYRIVGTGLNDAMRSIAMSVTPPTIDFNAVFRGFDKRISSLAMPIPSPDLSILAKVQSKLPDSHLWPEVSKIAANPTIKNVVANLSLVRSDYVEIVDRPETEPILQKAREKELKSEQPLSHRVPRLELGGQMVATLLDELLTLIPVTFKEARGQISNAALLLSSPDIHHNPRAGIVRSLYTAMENICCVHAEVDDIKAAIKILKKQGLHHFIASTASTIDHTIHNKDWGLHYTRHGTRNFDNKDYPYSLFIPIMNHLFSVIHAFFCRRD